VELERADLAGPHHAGRRVAVHERDEQALEDRRIVGGRTSPPISSTLMGGRADASKRALPQKVQAWRRIAASNTRAASVAGRMRSAVCTRRGMRRASR
jgi:hypothetical protein